MATTKPTFTQEPSSEPLAAKQEPQPVLAQGQSPSPPTFSAVKRETPTAIATAADVRENPRPALLPSADNLRPVEPFPSSDAVVVHVPSYARWFSFDDIHQCEVRFLPEFFNSRSYLKNPGIYKYYRNSIVNRYRADASRKISFTDVRKTLVGDVGSIRRVFDFLEGWGLINYSPPALNKPLKWEDKESKTGSGASHGGGESGGASSKEKTKRLCNHCKSICSIACFVCDKNGMTLCARCYVRGNYQIGDVTSSDFRRVEINDASKADWQERDTQHLLEALTHYGDDWRKVARHVGKTEKDCVSHFIKLPFGEEFSGFADFGNVNGSYSSVMEHDGDESCETYLTKRMRLTPLADASNPIMAQAAFLSALAGVEVAEAAARAAVTALSEADYGSVGETTGARLQKSRQVTEAVTASNGNTNSNTAEGALDDAKSQLAREEQYVERAISGIIEVQMQEIKDKIDHLEALDLHMEKEWQQLEQMENMLFVDQLTLLFHRSPAQKTGERMVNSVKTD